MIRWHVNAGHPIDTHVLIHHSRSRPQWLEQCLASLENEPTNVVLVDDPSTNVGEVRAIAMREGSAPFLSFVDDDDWVIPGVFAECLAHLEDEPGLVGVYTNFADVDVDTGRASPPYRKKPWNPRTQLTHPFEVLHVHVYRRALTMPYLDGLARWPTLEESWLMGKLAAHGDWRHIPFDGYRKRLHGFGAGARASPDHPEGKRLLRAVTNELAPILLKHPAGMPVRNAAVQWIDAADRNGRGCAPCKAARATARKMIARTMR